MKCELKKINTATGHDEYEMYQDIPELEWDITNRIKGVSYEEYLAILKQYIKDETVMDEEIRTTTNRYILYVDDLPIGDIAVRTTLSDFWINHGSQVFYKIRLSQRGKGYGNILLKLALEECKKLGMKTVRVNCDDENIPSKKVILKNGGVVTSAHYKSKIGYSSSYLIDLGKVS